MRMALSEQPAAHDEQRVVFLSSCCEVTRGFVWQAVAPPLWRRLICLDRHKVLGRFCGIVGRICCARAGRRQVATTNTSLWFRGSTSSLYAHRPPAAFPQCSKKLREVSALQNQNVHPGEPIEETLPKRGC